VPKPVTIRAKALDGKWETIGADRAFGVWPEGLNCDSDGWGSTRASFELKRDGRHGWPDVAAATQMDIDVAGRTIWSGRVSETPNSGQRSMSIQCEGWQYHLDDEMSDKFYLHNRITDWQDSKSFPNADLTSFPARFNPTTGGRIIIGAQAGQSWTLFTATGVTLDLGPGNAANAIGIDLYRGPGAPGTALFVRGHDNLLGAHFNNSSEDYNPGGTNMNTYSQTPGVSSIVSTITTGRRYISIFVYNNVGTYTATADDVMIITGIRVFDDTTYQSGGVSTLQADTIIKDAITRNNVFISRDFSDVNSTGLALTDFYMQGSKTSRETINAANAYHNYVTKIDTARRMVFQGRGSTARLVAHTDWGAVVEDSGNSMSDVYNLVDVEWNDPSGVACRITRSQPGNPPTIIDRQGFTRRKSLQIGFTLPTDGILAAAIGDAWLLEHRFTPFKGSVKLKDGSVREMLSGEPIPVEILLTHTDELLLLNDRVEPDTGNWGRLGRIVAVSWNHAADEVTLSMDNTRSNFEALLSRMAVIVSTAQNVIIN
jgi:hypothetical protein